MKLLASLCAMLTMAAVFSGCTSAPATVPTTEPSKQLDSGVDKVDVPLLPDTVPSASERNLTSVPQWRLGEFWKYHIVDEFSGASIDTTRVVAGTDGSNYLVGFPLEAFSNDVLVLHMPGYGDVAQADLSYEVHDVVFKSLQFPLRTGDTWASAFEGRPGNAVVEAVEGSLATITLQGQGFNMTATYDAQAGEFTKLEYPGYMHYEVSEHGFHYTGLVRVPHAHDLVFQNGRIGGVLDIQNFGIPPPTNTALTDTVDIPAGYDHLAFTLLASSLLAGGIPNVGADQTPAGGYYDEKATSPNGTVYEITMMPQEFGTKIQFFGTGDPTGPWTLSHTAAGPGLVLAEGIGYHSIDVTLPSGCVVQSVNSGHHVARCKVTAAAAGDTQTL